MACEPLELRRLLSADATTEVLAVAALPSVQLKVTEAEAAESGTPASTVGKFVVSRSGSKAEPLVIRLVVSGTAWPEDFVLSSRGIQVTDIVTIPAGKTSATVIVTPVDDAIAEPLETLDISLADDPAYSSDPKHRTGAVTIADNEPIVSIIARKGAREAANPAKGNGSFIIRRTGSTNEPLVVNYVLGGSATLDVDYTGLTGVVTIPAGKSSVKLPVHAVLDANAEGRETVTVTLAPDAAYHVSPKQPSAGIGIKNVFSIDTIAAFDDVSHTYTSTFRTTLRGVSQRKSITTADATFPLDIVGFGAATPVKGKYLILNGAKSAEGVFLDSMLLNQRTDQPSDLELRSVETRGADTRGGLEHSVLLIPPIVGPSTTRKLFTDIAVHGAVGSTPGSQGTVPGTVQVTSKATKQVQVKTPAGTFSATKLVVTVIVTGKGRVTVNARLTRNGPEIQRRIHVSVNDQFTWTYYLVEGMGVVRANVSGAFKQTTEFPMTFKAKYVMTPPAPAAEIAPETAPVTA